MNTLAALGWGARLTSVDCAELLDQAAAFLEDVRTEGVHRQPLLLQDIDVRRKNRSPNFPTANQSGPWR